MERLNRLEKIVESNARAIEAFLNEWQKDRTRLYKVMTRVASAQTTFWEIEGDYYRRLEEMDKRQADIIEILRRLTLKAEN